jgi:hypothetical protein
MTDKLTFTPADAGCLIDGHHGWHGHAMAIDLAVDAGMPLTDQDQDILDRYRSGDPDQDPEGNLSDAMINQGGLLDQSEDWLNDHAAPEGYSFGWHDGEFFLWSTETWEEV